jgi:hypothetical protein
VLVGVVRAVPMSAVYPLVSYARAHEAHQLVFECAVRVLCFREALAKVFGDCLAPICDRLGFLAKWVPDPTGRSDFPDDVCSALS